MPERVVLVHVECARDAHRTARSLVRREARAVEEQLVLVLEEVGRLDLVAFAASALFATVARDEAAATTKVIDGEQAVVGAATTMNLGMLDLKMVNLVLGKQGGNAILARTLAREQGRTVGTHRTRDVGTDDLTAREQLKRTQRGVRHEGSALHHHVLADLLVIAQLDDLEEGVLDDGIAEARGHVANGCALLLGLLDAAVHEHRAAAAKVHRLLAVQRRCGKVLHAHAHRVREARDE